MATHTWDPITGTCVLRDDQSFAVTTEQLDQAADSTATFTWPPTALRGCL